MSVVARADVGRWGWWFVAEHQLRVLWSYRWSTVANVVGTPVLYLFAFGIGLGSLVTDRFDGAVVDAGSGGGVDYLTFVAPALLCAAALTLASTEFSFPVMLGFKWNAIFVGMNASPLTPGQIMAGHSVFVVIRMAVATVVYLAVLVLFGAAAGPGILLAVPIALLAGLAFGAPLMAYATHLESENGQFAIVQRVIVLPLVLFSGTVFPLEQLPIGLQWIGWISPLWHGTQLARVLSYGAPEPTWLTVLHLVVLVAYAVVGFVLTVRFARRRLNR